MSIHTGNMSTHDVHPPMNVSIHTTNMSTHDASLCEREHLHDKHVNVRLLLKCQGSLMLQNMRNIHAVNVDMPAVNSVTKDANKITRTTNMRMYAAPMSRHTG